MARRQKNYGPHPREKQRHPINIGKSKRLKNYYINRKLLQKYFIRAS